MKYKKKNSFYFNHLPKQHFSFSFISTWTKITTIKTEITVKKKKAYTNIKI